MRTKLSTEETYDYYKTTIPYNSSNFTFDFDFEDNDFDISDTKGNIEIPINELDISNLTSIKKVELLLSNKDTKLIPEHIKKELEYYLGLKKLILEKKSNAELLKFISSKNQSNIPVLQNFNSVKPLNVISNNLQIESISKNIKYLNKNEIKHILQEEEKEIPGLSTISDSNITKLISLRDKAISRNCFLLYKINIKFNMLLSYIYIYLFFKINSEGIKKFSDAKNDFLRNNKDLEEFINKYLNEERDDLKFFKTSDNNIDSQKLEKILTDKKLSTSDDFKKKILELLNKLISIINEKSDNSIIIKKMLKNITKVFNYTIKKTDIKNIPEIKEKISKLLKLINDDEIDEDDDIKGGKNDDFTNLKEQIIDFYNNDIILKYIYTYDQIILFNYLNYIINKNKNIEVLLKNIILSKLINKDFINNLIRQIKHKLDLNDDDYYYNKKKELLELKQFFKSNDIIIESFDNFINYLFVYLLSVKNETNNIIINNNIYDLDNIPTLNIYNIPNKDVIIIMSNEEEELAYQLLNNTELLVDFIYMKFNYLRAENKEFNNNNSFIINENILNYLNKINNKDKILNKLKEIVMKLNNIHIYGGANDKKDSDNDNDKDDDDDDNDKDKDKKDDKNKDKNDEDDIRKKALKFINNSINSIKDVYTENVGNKFIPKKPNSSSNTVINRIVEKYDNSEFPNELKKYEFYNSVKNNNLDPSVELELTSVDKYIFVVVMYVIRLITLYVCYYYIDRDIITDIKFSIYYYLLVYIFIFIIAIIIINFDTFKLRILINYMNLHINTSGIFTHIILISLFIYLIFLLINNIIGIEQPPTQLTESQKIKLKYKLDILTLIIYIFLCIFVVLF